MQCTRMFFMFTSICTIQARPVHPRVPISSPLKRVLAPPFE